MATVTEVVWEGEEPDSVTDKISAKTAENKTLSSATNRLDCTCA